MYFILMTLYTPHPTPLGATPANLFVCLFVCFALLCFALFVVLLSGTTNSPPPGHEKLTSLSIFASVSENFNGFHIQHW